MISYVAAALGLPLGCFYIVKFLWRAYILWTARDPTSKYSHLPIPPGDFGIPIIGETISWALQGSRFNVIRRQKYGKIFSSNYIGRTMVKVTGPEYIKQILTASHEDVNTIWPTTVRRLVGEAAVSNSIGAVHKRKRKALLKAFTHTALSSYVPQIRRIVKKHIESWMNSKETPLIYLGALKMTYEVGFRVLVGLPFRNEEEEKLLFQTFDTMITNIMSLPYEFPGSGFSKALKAKKIIHEILDELLERKRKNVQEKIAEGEYAVNSGDESLKNALHIILEAMFLEQAGKQNGRCKQGTGDVLEVNSNSATGEDTGDHELTGQELKALTVEMLFAGYQTTSSAVSSVVFHLIKHPEVFRKLEDDLRQYGLLDDTACDVIGAATRETATKVPLEGQRMEGAIANNNNIINCKKDFPMFGSKDRTGDAESEVTLQLISRMRYLEQVMKETLRVAPPILGGYRKAEKTFQLGNYRVPKGWTIIYNITDTHESEWKDDREFNPDRFSPENWTDGRESRFRWIPFGGGSRICVGKEFARLQFKLFLIELVRNFSKIEFANAKPSKMFAIPFLHPTDGLPVRLTPRKLRRSVSESKKTE